MARIAGIDLPKNKHIVIALTYIYGIGRSTAESIVSSAKIDPDTRTDKLLRPKFRGFVMKLIVIAKSKVICAVKFP